LSGDPSVESGELMHPPPSMIVPGPEVTGIREVVLRWCRSSDETAPEGNLSIQPSNRETVFRSKNGCRFKSASLCNRVDHGKFDVLAGEPSKRMPWRMPRPLCARAWQLDCRQTSGLSSRSSRRRRLAGPVPASAWPVGQGPAERRPSRGEQRGLCHGSAAVIE
jgi:hypothetical protein